MKIKNVKGSSKVSPNSSFRYDSWLNYWEQNSGIILDKNTLYKCPACGKGFYRTNFDGCHVQKANSTDQKWYIMPLCDSCNHRTDTPDVNEKRLIDVPSNLKITYSE